MRRSALISLVAAASFAGAFTFAAAGGDKDRVARAQDVQTANALTAKAASVHYHFAITLKKSKTPMTLHIRGASSPGRLLAKLVLGSQKGTIMLDSNFLYESAPSGIVVLGNFSWLRMDVGRLKPHSQVMSTLNSLTPSPLLRIVAESKLHALPRSAVFVGTVAYDDPVVRTALRDLANGYEFRQLRLRVVVGRDGRIHRLLLAGSSADHKTTFVLRARLFGFGTPVKITLPKQGTFMDPALERLQA
jgi:hypothetical protein